MDCGDPTSNLTTQQKKYVTNSPPAVTSFSIQIMLICKNGFKYSDNSPQNSIVCDATGKWSTTPNCQGTFGFLNFREPS